jgi:hypothetical protein
MNGAFEDDDHFNFDMVMHEPQFNSNKQMKDENNNENKQKKEIPITSRIKSKKNRKLALKKKNEINCIYLILINSISRRFISFV